MQFDRLRLIIFLDTVEPAKSLVYHLLPNKIIGGVGWDNG